MAHTFALPRWIAFVLPSLGCGSSSAPLAAPATSSLDLVWGTAAPYRLIASDPEGDWAVVCQARNDTDGNGALLTYFEQHGDTSGDEMRAFLVDRERREHPIDDVLAEDPTGRWLVLAIDGAPVLLDTRTWTREAMRAELGGFHVQRGLHRWTFDPTGQYLAYYRDGRLRARVLATGAETEVPQPVWSATWSEGGWLNVEALAGDTNGDGALFGPDLSPGSKGSWSSCGAHFDWGQGIFDVIPIERATEQDVDRVTKQLEAPDRLRQWMYRVDGKTADAVAALDEDTLVASGAGTLDLVSVASGRRTRVADCDAEVLETYQSGLLYACRLDGASSSVRWYREGAHATIVPRVAREDLMTARIGRTARVVVGSEHGRTIDLITSTPILSDGWVMWSDHQRFVLVRDTPQAYLVELRWADGRRVELPPAQDDPARRRIVVGLTPRYLVYGDVRVDLTTGRWDKLARPAVTIRNDGSVLVDAGKASRVPAALADVEPDRMLAFGPLRWVR
ncbi:MAG: hypothetical protein SFX73_06120 [Kofleriaceae bacterium]|nr:hypothetical protein [Kofleriaceae bacterium]